MKTRNVLFSVYGLVWVLICGCTPSGHQQAVFRSVIYQGMDEWFEKAIDPHTEFFNPIVSGFYPDPSICRKGEDYYMVHSSFSYYPGVPILHSRDLVHWQQIGHVLNRPSQLQLDNIRLSGGIYAPDISYNEQDQTFYMITTCVDGIGNFVVKCKDPHAQSWSDPILLPGVRGIDPAFFFDEDGKAYIIHNDGPAGEAEYDGHRAIWLHEYDPETDETFGERTLLIDGGVDKSKKPIWIEGPHIYKINGTYYLMAAEGGTGPDHSEVIFTADHVKGPYTPVKENPILTQRDLPEDRPEKVTSVGHADLVQTHAGDWYAVFLGCRPYQGDMYNTGRETFLLPVEWKNDVPVILKHGKALPTVVSAPHWKPDTTGISYTPFTGNFTWTDPFTSPTLDQEWIFIRTPEEGWWQTGQGELHLTPSERRITEVTSPAFIGRRQQHTSFSFSVEIDFKPQNEKEEAGIVCYQNEKNLIAFTQTLRNGSPAVKVTSVVDGVAQEAGYYPVEKAQIPVHLKVDGVAGSYSFHMATERDHWIPVAESVDATHLSTHKAGGFTGCILGLYTCK